MGGGRLKRCYGEERELQARSKGKDTDGEE